MSDTDQTGPGGTLINFPRIGFNLSPTTTMPSPTIPPPPAHPPTPGPASPGPGARTGRRSPLDALNALPDPSLTTPLPAPHPTPGTVPATFRSEPDSDMVGPRLGALGLAAILAVAVAAMRGTHTVLSTWWENRQARQTETEPLRKARLKHQLAMQQAGYSSAQAAAKGAQRAKKVPSSSEFGSKSLRRSNSGGPGAGSGAGKSTSSKTNASGPGRKNNGSGNGPGSKSRTNTGPNSKNRGGAGGRTNGGDLKKNRSPKTPGPLRNSPRGAGALKKAGAANNTPAKSPKNPKSPGAGAGQGRTTLRKALAHTTQKAAARRLKHRRNNGASPAVWKNKKNVPQPGQTALGNGNTTKNQKTPKNPSGTGGKNTRHTNGRTTLAQALRQSAHRAARKRLKQRRRTVTPPIWTAPGASTPKVNLTKNSQPRAAKPGAATGAAGQTSQNGRTGQHTGRQQKNKSQWARARAYAQKNATNSGTTTGAGTAGAQQTGSTAGPPPKGWATWDQYWQHLNAQHNQRTGYNQTGRKSPFQNAGQAAGQAGATYTAERADYPGAQAKRWMPDAITSGTPALPSTGPAALDAAPVETFPRPGTTRPKEPIPMPPAPARNTRIAAARKEAAHTGRDIIAAAHMDAQHATEITLDDALDQYTAFKDKAFKTHDKCFKLATRARTLRDILAAFAVDLAVNHNLIGPLFSGAMARMSESMDLVARMADEMQISSLEAAEMAEAASDELDDAYRPYSKATADAGLSTPSAPIHNQS